MECENRASGRRRGERLERRACVHTEAPVDGTTAAFSGGMFVCVAR